MSEVIYSIALRCIAQDLVQRRLKTFDIKPEGNHFTALCGYQESSRRDDGNYSVYAGGY